MQLDSAGIHPFTTVCTSHYTTAAKRSLTESLTTVQREHTSAVEAGGVSTVEGHAHNATWRPHRHWAIRAVLPIQKLLVRFGRPNLQA